MHDFNVALFIAVLVTILVAALCGLMYLTIREMTSHKYRCKVKNQTINTTDPMRFIAASQSRLNNTGQGKKKRRKK